MDANVAREKTEARLARLHKRMLLAKREEIARVLKKIKELYKKGLIAEADRIFNHDLGHCVFIVENCVNGHRIECLIKCLTRINEALVRVQEGTYGICQECGEYIPLRRLEQVPFTRYCVPCKETKDTSQYF